MILGVAAVLAALTGFAAQVALTEKSGHLVLQMGLALLILAALVAANRRAKRGGPESMGWQAMALFLLIAFIIQGLRIIPLASQDLSYSIGYGSVLLQVIGSCLQIGALLLWQLSPRTRFDRLRYGLDGLLFALAILFVLWGLVLGPAFLNQRLPLLERMTWLATFLIYDLLLGLTVYLGLADPARFRGPLGWLAGAFLLASLHNFHSLMEHLSGGTPRPTPLMFAIPLAYLAAALSRWPVGSIAPPEGARRRIQPLPYLPVLGALVLGIWLLITGQGSGHHSVLLWLALALVIVLLVRQYLALRDFSALSQHLESRVAERTEALEKAQAILLRTERMNAMATLGAGLVHDVNNLLTTIQCRTELLILSLDEGSLPDRKDLEQVHETSQRASRLSSRLMTIGRQDAEPLQSLDLTWELNAIRPLLQVLLPRHQALRLDTWPGPLLFLGTRGTLEQILVNLVCNARDAMPSGGTITLRSRGPRPEEASPEMLLEIEDTGGGIPAAQQDQVFQPFFTTKTAGSGTGLGLVSVRAMVEQMGGSIGFISQAGRGTVFQIRLPVVAVDS